MQLSGIHGPHTQLCQEQASHHQQSEMRSGIPGYYSQTPETSMVCQYIETELRIWLHLPVDGQQTQSLQDPDFTHQGASTSPRAL